MNGRLYDAKLHRFLQPDNYVQDPSNTQNYNRYGYVLNNPLKYIDPSGEYGDIPGGNGGVTGGNGHGAFGQTINDPSNKEWFSKNMSARTVDKAGTAVGDGVKDAVNFLYKNFKSLFGIGKKRSVPPPPNMGTNVNMNAYTAGGNGSFGQGSFGSGLADGFGAGFGSTVGFVKSLGTTQGWQAVGDGFYTVGMAACLICPEGSDTRTQMVTAPINYIQNVLNMSAYEMGYDLGFGTEKGLELVITRRVMPLPKSYLGVRNVGNASKFTTIQSLNTYRKWGILKTRSYTWPTGGYTLDRATFYNRNFIIPTGRVIGAGQLQYLQNE